MRTMLVLLTIAFLASVPAAATAGPAENKAAALRIIEDRLGQGRFDGIAELYDPGFVGHGTARDFDFEESQDNTRQVRAAFPDLHIRVERIAAEGDLVALHWIGTGTNSVRIGPFPGTGRRVEIGGMVFFRFRDNRIVEEWAVSDNLSVLAQLGLLPPPPPQ